VKILRSILPLCLACALWSATDAHAVRFERIDNEGQRYVVAHVDPKQERIEIFPAPREGNTFAYVERQVDARKQKLVFATNGGMYQPDYSAVGLLVVRGKELKPLNTAKNNPDFNFTTKPNGVFAVTRHGARVVETSRYAEIAKDTLHATQSGPALVLDGRLHPGLQPSSTSRHVRNGVGVTKSGEAIFVISESGVTLHEFATLFRDRLECPNALYFDGSVSSLHAPALDRSDSFRLLGPIVGVVE
jgi:uncharacterized protein YigE (DUF2233 family)